MRNGVTFISFSFQLAELDVDCNWPNWVEFGGFRQKLLNERSIVSHLAHIKLVQLRKNNLNHLETPWPYPLGDDVILCERPQFPNDQNEKTFDFKKFPVCIPKKGIR